MLFNAFFLDFIFNREFVIKIDKVDIPVLVIAPVLATSLQNSP